MIFLGFYKVIQIMAASKALDEDHHEIIRCAEVASEQQLGLCSKPTPSILDPSSSIE